MIDLWRKHLAWRFMPALSAQRHFERKRNREARAKAKARGMCSGCLKRPPRPGMLTCEECHRSTARWYVWTRDRRNDAGLCARCRAPKQRASVYHCDDCITLASDAAREREAVRGNRASG